MHTYCSQVVAHIGTCMRGLELDSAVSLMEANANKWIVLVHIDFTVEKMSRGRITCVYRGDNSLS